MKRFDARFILPALLVMPLLAVAARADVIMANYNFVGQSLNSADTDDNSTAGSFAITFGGSASTTSTLGGSAYAFASVVAGDSTTPGTEAAAITLGRYFSFTVMPENGFQLDLTTLSLDILLDANPSGTPAPFGTWFLKSSIGGFLASDPTLGSRNAPVSTTDTAIATINPLIDLSSLPALTSQTEFRLYIYDNRSSGSEPHRLDNVVLRGDVSPIPEPGTVVLLAAGLLLLRRRVQA